MSITKETLEQKLIAELQATHVEITDTSGGCGAMFEAVIVSPLFAGKPLLARHRMVNELLKTEMAEIHAFSQKTYTPEQWEAQKNK